MLLHMCPHAAICVLMLLHVRCFVASSHMYLLMLLHTCPHAIYYICTHTTIPVSSCYAYVLMHSSCYMCVLMLLLLRMHSSSWPAASTMPCASGGGRCSSWLS